jgi:SAM-dependent methyltransferase
MNYNELNEIIRQDERYDISADSLVFDFSENSDSAVFYDDQFSDNEYSVEQIKGVGTEIIEVPSEIISIQNILKNYLKGTDSIVELGGSYLQFRSGFLHEKYVNYFPMDISRSSMYKYSRLFHKAAVVANAERIPLKDQSVNCVISHTFLEHTIDPQAVLSETGRILKKGGLVVHCDAWHCRWWQRFGIVGIRKFSTLTLKEKTIVLFARITEFPLFRKPLIVVRRIAKELFVPVSKPIGLIFGKLEPNYSLHLYCDEDAASSIDPLNVIRFYESRGFSYYKKLSFFDRIFFNDPYVILIKR